MNQKRNQRIEKLIERIDSFPDPELRSDALELIQSLMELHGEGLDRLLEIIAADQSGLRIIDRLGRDELVGSLLLLYGLHPVDLESRVQQALEKVRPYLKAHGGNVTLVELDEGALRIQLERTPQGCASTAMNMKLAVEAAVYEAAPDISQLIVVDPIEEGRAPVLVQLQIARSQPVSAAADGK